MVDTYIEATDRLNDFLNVSYATKFPVAAGSQAVSKVLQWIDLYAGQPEEMVKREMHNQLPFQLPALFLEFSNISWDTYRDNLQEGNLQLKIHVLQQSMADTYYNANRNTAANNRTRGLNLILYLKQVSTALQGWRSSEMRTMLKRTSTQFIGANQNVSWTTMDFVGTIKDEAAYSYRDWIRVTTALNVQHDNTI